MDTTVFSLKTVREFMLAPNFADDGNDRSLLVVDLGSGLDAPDTEIDAMAAWLARQPLPTVGIDAARAPDRRLAGAMDLHVDEARDIVDIASAVEKNPVASAVLVQVLRTMTHLPVELALAVESLAYATLQGGEEFSRWLSNRSVKAQESKGTASPVLVARDGSRLKITLDSPGNRNALSAPMRDGLSEALKLVTMDPSITAVDVSGNGPCFSAGGDLTEFGTSTDTSRAHLIRSLRMPAQYLVQCADRCTFHLHGACIGAGIELPAFAHRLIAQPGTLFRLPEVGMGLIPGAGGCVSISRRIGRQRTAWMAITGRDIPATQALAWGLIDEIAA